MFENVPWHALKSVHARFAIWAGNAVRYPIDVTPFAATVDHSADSLHALASLLDFGETVYLMSDVPPRSPELQTGEPVPVLQMLGQDLSEMRFPDHFPDDADSSLIRMTRNDAGAMVELTEIAFPGFFRSGTYRMGTYYGIRVDNELVAMAGERMALPGYIEVSGVCTRPGHTGKGCAARLIRRLMKDHAGAGVRSFLHVKSENQRAVELYKRLGFFTVSEPRLYPVTLQK